jgi:hypothetical protein
MRPPVDEARLREFARELARVTSAEAHVYLTGGATAVLEGWRTSTADIDVRIEPERDALLRALPELKDRLQVNVELASPPDFIPELPGWRERSPLVIREGSISLCHFDFYSQALAKIERGFTQDLEDVRSMIAGGRVDPRRLRRLFEQVEPDLYRYPAIDPAAFKAAVDRALGD